MTIEALACTTNPTHRQSHGVNHSTKNNRSTHGLVNVVPSVGQTSTGTNGSVGQNRECIQIVSFFHRKTAETACLETRLAKNQVTRVCVIRPNSVFYTLSESLSRKLYCCLATRDNVAHAGRPIFSCRKSIVEITNLSYDGHTRVGVLCTDGLFHILLLLSHVPQQWDHVASIPTDLDVSVYREVAYSRSFNSLFWPIPSGDDYTVIMYDIEGREMRTLLTRVKNCTLQVKQDALVILFYDHGVLFVPFNELNNKLNLKCSQKAQINGSTDDFNIRQPVINDSGLSRSCSMLDFNTEPLPIRADYWNPSTADIKRIQAEAFVPSISDQHLRGYCLSHDRTVVFAMYGNTVYRLSGTGCAPLVRIEIPTGMDTTFRVMFLGRITVLQVLRSLCDKALRGHSNANSVLLAEELKPNVCFEDKLALPPSSLENVAYASGINGDTMTAAYLNSSKPVKVLHRNYRSAGFGFVWDESGVYQIRMCNPVEMSDELQAEMLSYNPSYRAANLIGRAISGDQMNAGTGGGTNPVFKIDAQKHLASPALLNIAGAYTSATNEDVSEKFMKVSRVSYQSIEDFKSGRSKLGAFRRLENTRRKIKAH
ncbi:hypothetical protein BIW11_07084 [Tropilaelaps mercedesae]|uniref:Uncharacterized protein n=1 Tax=Tropilaelaps mercedesae TaxID=418985 RepID=A0A1V9XVF2_9ACAR|nr:hypothetical protein BIW11_07084 [Tropilaelaps mercedesae]